VWCPVAAGAVGRSDHAQRNHFLRPPIDAGAMRFPRAGLVLPSPRAPTPRDGDAPMLALPLRSALRWESKGRSTRCGRHRVAIRATPPQATPPRMLPLPQRLINWWAWQAASERASAPALRHTPPSISPCYSLQPPTSTGGTLAAAAS
jgi:hypothetical protein